MRVTITEVDGVKDALIAAGLTLWLGEIGATVEAPATALSLQMQPALPPKSNADDGATPAPKAKRGRKPKANGVKPFKFAKPAAPPADGRGSKRDAIRAALNGGGEPLRRLSATCRKRSRSSIGITSALSSASSRRVASASWATTRSGGRLHR